jgi:hypothetical protein
LRLKESYEVAAAPVLLGVTVGEGHKGFVEVRLEGTKVAEGEQIRSHTVGQGQALIGKTLRIISNVVATSPSKLTSITYTLSGGKSDRTFTSQCPISDIGDVVDYEAKFLFASA